ncbi:glycosyltransferase [Streptomyces sp. NPDC051105]|uniref:glycosyltransferase n=1 Tax=Streptomyces sp. NPDC051105 TaxID=3154843 RepID=UPI0034151504
MIGYYIHHQGRGHLHRALCIARHAKTPITALSCLPRPADWSGAWVRLAQDNGPGTTAADPAAHGRLHWAPRHHPGLRTRMADIAQWIRLFTPALLISDVSVEVATFARLMGIPVVVAAMRGERDDPGHRLAYDLADTLLAPWPETIPEPGWPDAWYAKTAHTGAFSRYDGRKHPERAVAGREVLLMLGAGGADMDETKLREAAQATPGWRWTVLGGPGGWTEDPWPLLCRSDVVVTHAGQNAIAECAAAHAPAVVIPQDRPHGEQHATARALTAASLATVCDTWPTPQEWPALLEWARHMGGERWSQWAPGDGAVRAARLIDSLATHHMQRGGSHPLLWEGVSCAQQ